MENTSQYSYDAKNKAKTCISQWVWLTPCRVCTTSQTCRNKIEITRNLIFVKRHEVHMVAPSGSSSSIYSATHTHTCTCTQTCSHSHTHTHSHRWASNSERTISTVQQSFYYCRSGCLDYSVYYSSAAWCLSPMLLMGHLLSCAILPPVQLACLWLQRWLLCFIAQNENKICRFHLCSSFW